MTPHRIRRLRWQARTPSAADAFALRTLLRERGDAVTAAFDRAWDDLAQELDLGDDVLHVARLELRIDAADLAALADGFEARLEDAARDAVRTAWQQARVPFDRRAAKAPAVAQRSGRAARRESLRHYLTTGALDWTLAGLAPEGAAEALRDAATEAASDDEAVEWLLGDGTAVSPRIDVARRWLQLMTPAQRRAWVARSVRRDASGALQRALDAIAALLDIGDADVLQALWIAWPSPLPPEARAAWRVELTAWTDRVHLAPAARQAMQHVAAALRDDPGAALPMHAALQARSVPAEAPSDAIAMLVPMAGLVLLHPYLPRLLGACDLLTADARALNDDALPRACALLHWLACGRDEVPEFDLPLIKLLLGAPPDVPLTSGPGTLRDADRDEANALLHTVPTHWTALRGTGTDGLRLSFLQRRGLLEGRSGAWQLRMQGEAFDMLLTTLPWAIGIVKLPWMAEPLIVEWAAP